jgi:hypothetical protein
MEDLAKFYLQGEPALVVFTEVEEVSKLRVEVEESKNNLNIINTLVAENTDLKHRIKLAEQQLAEMGKTVRELVKLVTENLKD